jgi:cobalamin biosynthesis Mg chelatase CobN
MGKTLGTTIPLFSAGLIENLIKSLSFKAIWNIILRHPRRERKIAFVIMYFASLKDRIGPLAYKGFVEGILELENNLPEDGFLFGDFSHADINLMCCFYRLQDLRLDSVLEMTELPKTNAYWQNLKARDSYKKGILDFKDHEEKLNEIFSNKDNPHLEKLKKKIKEVIKI